MNKTAVVLFLATIATAVGLIGYHYARADDATAAKPKPALQGAVDNGIINQDTANKLQNYLHESKQQGMKDRTEERLNSAVKEGKVTEDEANQIRNWINSRSSAMDKLGRWGFGVLGR